MEKKIPPIQPAPFQRFTIRLVDGHFVRVPRIVNIAATDATRPPTVMPPGAVRARAAMGSGEIFPRTMRLINGRFVRVTELAEDRSAAETTEKPPAARPPVPVVKRSGKPGAHTEPWAVTFGSQLNSSDSPTKP